MKTFFTFLSIMLISFTLIAQRNVSYNTASRLSISTAGNGNLRVMIDGNRYKSENNRLLLSNISTGYHAVKIYQLKRKARAYGNSNNSLNGYQLVYSGNVYLKPQVHTDMIINRFGKLFMDEQSIRYGYQDDEEADDWGDNAHNDQYNNHQVMGIAAFEQLKQTLRNETYDNTRTTIAKQAMALNYFSSAQVKELVQLFSYESSKLEVAKYAYKFTVDKGNYFTVNNAFTYSSSKDELMRFIQSQ